MFFCEQEEQEEEEEYSDVEGVDDLAGIYF